MSGDCNGLLNRRGGIVTHRSLCFAESSNGRMQRFERCHVGSSPASAVIHVYVVLSRLRQ